MPPVADVAAIKPVAAQGHIQNQSFTIPLTQDMPLADGTGTAKVIVQTITVTAQQLQQQIIRYNSEIARAQAQVDDLQKKLDAITTLQGVSNAATPVVSAPEAAAPVA